MQFVLFTMTIRNNEIESSAKARQRWAKLRSAIVGGTSNPAEPEFQGFQLLKRTPLSVQDENGYEFWRYEIPLSDDQITVVTREKAQRSNSKLKREELFADLYFGVDNTSNVKVWDSEGILTYWLLQILDKHKDYTNEAMDWIRYWCTENQHHAYLRICELGCGMAGIAGLALASYFQRQACSRQVQVVLTDGHPNAVQNNLKCVQLTWHHSQNICNDNVAISTQRLLWDDSTNGAQSCLQLIKNHQAPFQLMMVSDCLHFVDFHVALAATIGRLLDSNGGVCILCQPPRGTSMQKFINLLMHLNTTCTEGPIFAISLLDHYDPQISLVHQQYVVDSCRTYDPNKHYPQMLILRKLRSFNEVQDISIMKQSYSLQS